MKDPTKENKRSREQKESDYELIARQVEQGKSHIAIATFISSIRPYTLSRQQVDSDVRKIESRWRETAAKSIDSHKARLLAGLYEQKRELWEAWEASKKESQVKTVEVSRDGVEKQHERIMTVTKGQYGDVSIQNALIAICDRIAKLLGADAPTKTVLTGADGGPVQVSNEPVVIIEANGFEADTTRITKAEECPNSEPK